MAGVAINALPGADVVSVGVSGARPLVIRLHSGCQGANNRRDQERDNRRLDDQLLIPGDRFQLEAQGAYCDLQSASNRRDLIASLV